jgi:hypothetical protein
MGKIKSRLQVWIDDVEVEEGALIEPDKYWRTAKDQRWVLIAEMDYQHLENIVDFFSRDGWVVDPARQNAFDNVMIEYMRRKLDNEALLKKAIDLMEKDHDDTKMSA